jgi:ferredoxin
MNRSLCASWPIVCIVSLLLLAMPRLVGAVERFPPPDFTDHRLPQTATPAPEIAWWDYADVAALGIALLIATWLAVFRRSRRGILVFSIVCLAYFGFFRAGCVCAIGSIQNVSLGLAGLGYAVPLAVLFFFIAPLAVALFYGRTFCAAVCPHGALQDLVLIRAVSIPRWVDHVVGLLAYLYLGFAVLLAVTGSGFMICRYDPFIGIFRLSGSFGMLLLGGGFVLASLVVARPYCRYVCPLGALFRLTAPFSRRHVSIYPDRCIQCRLCEQACPINAIEPPVPPSPITSSDRRRVVIALAAFPVIIAVSTALVGLTAPAMSRMHPTIQLAERMTAEQAGRITQPNDATQAFRNSGQPVEQLYAQAAAVRTRFAWGTYLFGAWIGLVIGVKIFTLARRRPAGESYEVDRGACVACGRCFPYCPRDPRSRFVIDEDENTADQSQPGGGLAALSISAGGGPERDGRSDSSGGSAS